MSSANYTVPKESTLLIHTLEFHRNKKFWGDDALEFKPERFEPENIKKVHPYAYFPFLNGSRMCPGYKYATITMKIFISRFIMKYQVTTDLKYEDLEFVFNFSRRLKEQLTFNVIERK